MKLIFESNDGSNTAKYLKVSSRGMKILLDFFAWIDVQGSFRLTPDAPESAVGDSNSASEYRTNETCPLCRGYGFFKRVRDKKVFTCHACDGQGFLVIKDES